MTPRLVGDADGDWLLVYGTPSRNGSSLMPTPAELQRWHADVRQQGIAALVDCEGVFALVAYDKNRHELAVLTDRSGMIPVYLSQDAEGLWIGSSATSLACLRTTTLSAVALASVIVAGHCLRDSSLFCEIQRVGPGEELRYDGQRLKRRRWWTPPAERIRCSSVRELAEEVLNERITSLRQRLSLPARVISTLTAGQDSRLDLHLGTKLDLPASYITWASGNAAEAPTAQAVAERLGLAWKLEPVPERSTANWRSLIVQSAVLSDGETQPFRGTTHWASSVGGGDSLILWGLGGEILRDYWSGHERIAWLLKGSSRMERLVNHRCETADLPPDLFDPRFLVDAKRRVIELFAQSDAELPQVAPRDRLDMLYIMERMRRWASLHLMTASWWCISEFPFVGQKMLDLAYALPQSIKRSSNLLRWMTWLANPEAAQVPINEGYAACPREMRSAGQRIHDGWLDVRHLLRKLRLTPSRGPKPAHCPRCRRIGRFAKTCSHRPRCGRRFSIGPTFSTD